MDRFLEALTMHLELLGRDLETMRANSGKKDRENIRALACISEIHKRRLTSLDGSPE